MLALPEPLELRRIRAAGNQLLLQSKALQGLKRVVCLGTFNLDWLPAFLAGACEEKGLAVCLEQGEFGQVSNLLYDDQSVVYQKPLSSLVIVAAIEDLLSPIFTNPRLDAVAQLSLVEECFEQFREGLVQFLARIPEADCLVVVHPPALAPNLNVANPLAAARGELAISHFENLLTGFAKSEPRLRLVGWADELRRLGSLALSDARLWYLARMRLNERGVYALAHTIAGTLAAIQGKIRKVAVFDLDNTLWGGVVGEVGWQGIELGNEGLGLAYRDVQGIALKWLAGGTVLALCSKNNPSDAHEVFEQHPEMLLRREDIAAERINWQDKAANLRELAEELNLGLDSFVFFDDNPAERAWVRQALPMVLVPEMPQDIAAWPDFLQQLTCFQRWEITSEDTERTQNYRAERERQEYRKTAATFEEYLASLGQKLQISRLQPGNVARAAQLCQRTNQFNLTTQRYTATELQALADGGAEIYLLSVADRFGNHGVTGMAILKQDTVHTTLIESLLLSCRVLGRGIETAFLAWLANHARAQGVNILHGRYIPTTKNSQVADFYPRQGFRPISAEIFELDLRLILPLLPDYLETETDNE